MKKQQTGREAGQADRAGDRSQESRGPIQDLHDLVWGRADERAAAKEAMADAGGLWDRLAPAIGEMITDVRKRVFEEGFFGREVTPREVEVVHHGRAAEATPAEPASRPLTFEDLMKAQAAMMPSPPDLDRNAPTPAQEGPDM